MNSSQVDATTFIIVQNDLQYTNSSIANIGGT